MTNEQFAALVERNQALARRSPGLYRLRVALLALLGYAYMFGLALVALIFSLGLALVLALKPILLIKLIKFVWAPVLFVWAVLKAMFQRLPPPEGEPLDLAQAPELFAEIERERAAQDAAPIHQVLITDEFNAAIAQRPRFGLFGGSRNTLILGFRLLTAFSPDQFRAVLAHELGHLSGSHGYWGSRIYHLRRTWGQLQEQTANQGGLSGWLVGRFLGWYAPYFNAYSFPLARQQEYEADAAAARMVGAEAAASALVAVNVVSDWQGEHFWSPLIASARHKAAPPVNPYTEMLRHPALPREVSQVEARLGAAMREITGLADTHPSLADRLAGIGSAPQLAPPPEQTAATLYLGSAAARFADLFGERWQASNAEAWRSRYESAERERAELSELEQLARNEAGETVPDGLNAEQRFRMAVLIERERGDATAARRWLDAALAAAPEHAPSLYMRGRLCLEADEATGLADLEAAIQHDAEAIKPAAELAWRWLSQRDRKDEAEAWAERWRERDRLESAIEAERRDFGIKDQYLPPSLSEEAVARLRKVLSEVAGLRQASLVQKRLRHLQAERPAYLLLGKGSPWTLRRRKRDTELQQRLQQALNQLGEEAATAGLPTDITAIIDGPLYAPLARHIRKQVKQPAIWQR